MKKIAVFLLWVSSSLFGTQLAYVANYAGNNISIVDLTNMITLGYVDNGSFPLQNPGVVKFTPDNTKAFVLSQTNNAVFVIDPTQNLIVAEVNVGAFPFSGPANIDITSDGTKAYVTNPNNNTVSVIDVATNTVTGYVNPNGFPFNYPFDVSFSTNGALAGVTNFLGNNVSIIDATTNTVLQYAVNGSPAGIGPRNIGLIDNTSAYVTDYNSPSAQAVAIIDLNTKTVTGYVNPNGFPFSNAENLFISFDLQHAYIESDSTNKISIVDIPTNTVTGFINASFGDPNSFHVNFDNTLMYVVNTAINSITLIDLTANTQIGVVNSSAYPFNTPVSMDLSNLIAPVISSAPTDLQGFKKHNIFASQTDLINLITWAPPLSNVQPTYYQIYRDAALTNLAGTVQATDPLQFIEHDRHKGRTYTYYVVAIGANGTVSEAAEVSISWK